MKKNGTWITGSLFMLAVMTFAACGGGAGSVSNVAPAADAGPDRYVMTHSTVTLDGSKSADPDGNVLIYSWSFISVPSGSTAQLPSGPVDAPSFTADKEGSYVVRLIVSDGKLSSEPDEVVITAVTPVPMPDTGQTQSYTSTYGEDHDYAYNAPSYTDNGDGSITDTVTGLVWQKQGDATKRTWDASNAYCSSLNISGLTGWRLPTRMELLTIVDYGTFGPSVNAVFFPGTFSSGYWSSSDYANDTTKAWSVYFQNGYTNGNFKTTSFYVRCVHGQETSPLLTDNGDGTATDMKRGLMWQQQDDDTMRTWEDALSYCEGLSLASYGDWRLPNARELNSIYDDARFNPAIDPVFANAKSSAYWSSTTLAEGNTRAWVKYLGNADLDYNYKTATGYVRCVRGH